MMRMLCISRPKILTTLALGAWVVFSGCESTERKRQAEPADAAPMGEVEKPVVVSEPEHVAEPIVEPAPVVVKKARKSLATQAKSVGATAKRIDDAFWRIEKGGTVLELEQESRAARLNGTAIYLSRPFALVQGKWILSKADVDTVLEPAFLGVKGEIASRMIVLDPGHGGSENGAKNLEKGLLEKELNLEVCNRLKSHLEEAGFKVALTRYDDRLLPLEDRSEIANREGAGLFLSIHFNGSLNADAMGLETYVLTPPGEASTADATPEGDVSPFAGNDFDALNFELGMRIQSAMLEKMQRADRGFRKARFKVLKDIKCPGALIECGFLTNESEALLLGTPVYREKISQAISEAVVSFMETFGSKS